jgi:predicted Zn-dependent protease
VDVQTHREGAGWINAPHSHGCAAAPRAFDSPLIHTPNLAIAPGAEALDFDGLVGTLKKGIAIRELGARLDFQCLNGAGRGRPHGVYEVKDGKRVARLGGVGFLFRAPELWKGLLALGGPASRRPFARRREKGEPEQETWHTVTTVPGVVKQVTTIEAGRR